MGGPAIVPSRTCLYRGRISVMACIEAQSLFAYILLAVLSCMVSSNKPVILVSMDGMGWQFPGGQFAKTPNLDYVARTGVKAKYMKTITPTKTWPIHQTLLTGLYPESHGIISNRFWDPVFEEKFVFDFDCSNFDSKFWSASEPIWLTLQKHGVDTGVYFWPGFSSYETKPTYYKKADCKVNCSSIPSKDLPLYRNGTDGYPPYVHCYANYTISFPNRIDSIIDWLTSKKPPRFIALYVDQPDWVGHSDGPKSQKFKEEIEKVDRDAVGYMITKLRNVNLLDKVNLIFVADHSFVTVNSSRIIYLEDYLDPATYMATEIGPFLHLWPKEGKLEKVYANLTKLAQEYPQVNVYKKDEIPDEYHYRNNRRIPPVYVDAGIGWLFHKSRSNISKNWIRGAHGYPASEQMGAIFYARGPSFKKDYKIDHGLQAIDVYPMLCEILGLEPRPHNGSLANMKMMMIGDDGPTSKATDSSLLWQHGVIPVFICCSFFLTFIL